MVSLIKQEVDAKIAAGKGNVVDMDDWAGRVSLDVISQAGFGSDFESMIHPFNPLNNSYRAAFMVDESSRPLFVLSVMTTPALTKLLPLKKVREKFAGYRSVTDWVTRQLEERKKTMLSGDGGSKNAHHKDIISTVMKAGTIDTAGLVEQSKTLLGAGHGKFQLSGTQLYLSG
jgi:cytochrome P450